MASGKDEEITMAQLWGGRFTKETNQLVYNFNASISFDKKFYKQDMKGSMAHVRMLAKQGILSDEERDIILDGIEGILKDVESGKLEISDEYEDIHSFVEATLIDRIGDPGKKLHTGRSPLNLPRFLYLFKPASERLQDVAIENKDAIQIIRERDGVNKLTYCDPPYFGAERSYDMQIAAQYHARLHRVLCKCLGPVAVSYNDHRFIRLLYDDFYILAFTRDNPMAKRSGALYGELLMTNYDPTPFLAAQLTLFAGQETDKLRLELEIGRAHV